MKTEYTPFLEVLTNGLNFSLFSHPTNGSLWLLELWVVSRRFKQIMAMVSRMTIVFAYIHSHIVFCKKVPLKAILYISTNCFINYGAFLPLWFDTLSFPCFSLLCCIPSIPQFLCFTSKSSKGEDGLTFHCWEHLVSLHRKKGSPRKVHIW